MHDDARPRPADGARGGRRHPISPSEVILAWDASTDDVRVQGYEVLRAEQVVARVSATETSFTRLAAATEHCFRVRALDAAGNRSPASAPACAATAQANAPASPRRLRASSATARSVRLSWEPSPRPGVVYRIYGEQGKSIGATRETAFSAVGLRSGERHCYRVAAVDPEGRESARTPEACAAPQASSISSR